MVVLIHEFRLPAFSFIRPLLLIDTMIHPPFKMSIPWMLVLQFSETGYFFSFHAVICKK